MCVSAESDEGQRPSQGCRSQEDVKVHCQHQDERFALLHRSLHERSLLNTAMMDLLESAKEESAGKDKTIIFSQVSSMTPAFRTLLIDEIDSGLGELAMLSLT